MTERTREIGMRGDRRAPRARAAAVSRRGGVARSGAGGILAGIGAVRRSRCAGWPTLLSLTAIVGGFCFRAAVGIFFGYYPARKASMLKPIEALRYE